MTLPLDLEDYFDCYEYDPYGTALLVVGPGVADGGDGAEVGGFQDPGHLGGPPPPASLLQLAP